MVHQLQKEPRSRIVQDLPLICELHLRISDNNYEAVRCLVINNYKYSSTAKIVCRSTLDMVYNLAIMIANPHKYVPMYMKSGWREKFEQLSLEQESEYMKTFGGEWLDEYESFVDFSSEVVGVSEEEKKNVKKSIVYFPTAPQMMSPKWPYLSDFDGVTLDFLSTLMKAYYSKLSQIMHVSDPGLAIHAAPLIGDFTKKEAILSSEPLFISIMCIIILLSEINLCFGYQYGARCKEIWTYLALTIPLQKELYEIKYQKTL